MGVAEEDVDAGDSSDLLVKCEFAPLIPGQGLSDGGWLLVEFIDERIADERSLVAVGEVYKHQESAASFDEGRDCRVLLTTDDEVAFPVARLSAFRDFSRSRGEELHVLDLVVR